MKFLGFDTSNYTTSLAVFDGKNIVQKKIKLTVKHGERGLRQSEALFQHTKNIPSALDEIDCKFPDAVAVSTRPCNTEGSYMPCFLAGFSAASAAARAAGAPLFCTSHQVGHILAALYCVNRLDLVKREFIAFHLSGGTTQALLVSPSSENLIDVKILSQSLDLKAGQAIDRAGVAIGYDFPCGAKLDELAAKSNREFSYKPFFRGFDCSLSGIENKTTEMIKNRSSHEDIAKFVISGVSLTVLGMLKRLTELYPQAPVVFSGGVSSNSFLRKTISDYAPFRSYFAEPEYSLDNAAGIAVYAYLKSQEL